jgi:hypothetical protein
MMHPDRVLDAGRFALDRRSGEIAALTDEFFTDTFAGRPAEGRPGSSAMALAQIISFGLEDDAGHDRRAHRQERLP